MPDTKQLAAAGSPVNRRQVLRTLGIIGSASLVGCAADAAAGITGSTASSDAALSSLALSDGTLSPTFAAGTTSYTATVANSTSSITLTPAASTTGATISVNGTVVASGAASAAVALAIGTNAISIVVTAASGGSTTTYAVVVTRASLVAASCVLIPQETDGPYPLYSVLSNTAIVRKDVREGKTGVPLTTVLSLVNLNNSCAPIAGAAIYIWHCDKDGQYSGYSSTANGSHSGETFLRGIQVTDSNGQVAFTTIYPGWYSGRITHIHFEIFLNDHLNVTAKATSQMAFPQAITTAVYNSALYAARGQNTSVTSFASDNVFSDGTEFQLATVTGDVTNGYTAALTIGVAA